MKYKFTCPKCDKVYDKEMSVAEYDKFDCVCEVCGDKMTRVFESPMVKGDVGGAGSSGSCGGGCEPGCGGSCGGSCGSCCD